MISNYMIINYLDCQLKAATPLKVSSGRQRKAAANFDVSPYLGVFALGCDGGVVLYETSRDGC